MDIYVPDKSSLGKAVTRTTHLAIGAHQDDLELMAFHGIAECYKNKNKWFTGITLTDGSGSPRTGKYRHYSNDQMRKLRQKEQREAAKIGQYSVQFQLGYSSAQIKNSRQRQLVIDDCLEILQWARPSIVYLHNLADKHETHVAASLCALEALQCLPVSQRPKKVYGCEVWRNLDWLSDKAKVTLPVSKHLRLGQKLIHCFRSQNLGGKRYDLASVGRWTSNATFYESHRVDKEKALVFAMDLTPIISGKISPQALLRKHLKAFESEVQGAVIRKS